MNPFHWLQEHGLLLSVTDYLNGCLILLSCLTIYGFFTCNFKMTDIKQNLLIKLLSAAILITARFLAYPLMVFQLIAIRCGYDQSHCFQQTDTARIYINLLGLLINLALIYFQYVHQVAIYPQDNVAWAAPKNNYRISRRLMLITATLELSLVEYIEQSTSYYVLLIPLVIIQTFLLYIMIQHRMSYNPKVQLFAVLRDSFSWSCLVLALATEIFSEEPDATFYLQIITSTVILSALILSSKKLLQLKKLKTLKQKQLSDSDKLNVIYTILENQQALPGSEQEHLINQFYYQHIWTCKDNKCPCYLQNESNSGHGVLGQEKTLLMEEYDKNSELNQNQQESNFIGSISFGQTLKGFQLKIQTILKILFYEFRQSNRKNGGTIELVYLDIFIKVFYQGRLYSSLFELLQLKKERNITKDKKQFYYLKTVIFQKTKEIELSNQLKFYNVDQIILIEDSYQNYKKLVFDTTILLEKFWANWIKKDFSLQDQIQLSSEIINQYLDIKDIYEEIIELKPDYFDIVTFTIRFYSHVLNFENEAVQAQNYLRNMQQKMKIIRQSQQNINNEDLGLVIVSQNPSKKQNAIILINKEIHKMLGFQTNELVNKDLNFLIPKIVAIVHDRFIDSYLKRDYGRFLNSSLERVWINKSDGNILPVKIHLQTSISEDKGLLLVGFIDPKIKISLQNIECNSLDAFVLLADEDGYIANASSNFVKKFFKQSNSIIDDFKFNINDLFVNMDKFSQVQLRDGVQTQFVRNFLEIQEGIQKLVAVKVSVIEYQFSKNFKAKEVIFVLDQNFNTTFFTLTHEIDASPIPQDQKEDNDLADLQMIHLMKKEDEELMEGSQQSYSSQTSTNTNSNSLLDAKNLMDVESMPPSLMNLKKAIIIFFVVLICTSFAVLAVSLISQKEFKKDQAEIRSCIYLESELSSLKLLFRMLIETSQGNGQKTTKFKFEQLQDLMATFYDKLREDIQLINDDKYSKDSELNVLMKESVLQLSELQPDGFVKKSNLTFQSGVYQFMTKFEQFINMKPEDFHREMDQFQIRDNKMANLSLTERDAWFLIINGNVNLHEFVIEVADQYIIDGETEKSTYKDSILIISCTCIGITLIATFILIPVTFNLDNEELKVLQKWLSIQEKTKEKVLQDINNFCLWINDDIQEKKSKQNKNHYIESVQMVSGEQTINNPKLSQMIEDEDQKAIGYENLKKASVLQKSLQSQPQTKLSQLTRPKSSANSFIIGSSIIMDNDITHSDIGALEVSDKSQVERSMMMNDESMDQSMVNLHSYIPSTHQQVTVENQKTQGENTNDQQVSLAELKARQKQSMYKYFTWIKAKKSGLITCFSLVIVGYYLLSYLLTSKIFDDAADSFEYQKVVSRRTPCILSAFNSLIEKFSQNKTQYIGRQNMTIQEFILQECGGIENQILSYIKNPPDQLKEAQSIMTTLETQDTCSLIFSSNLDKLYTCQSDLNGSMRKGLQNAYSIAYYHILNELIKFQSRHIQTQKELDDNIYDKDTQEHLKMIFDVIIPYADYFNLQVELSIDKHIEQQIKEYIIIFSIFIVVLLVSLSLSLKYVIQALKNVVLRSRVLIKIIPINELKRINAIDKRKLLNGQKD